MPDNTNVNNSSAVVVVGRTAPVPPGQQKAEKSIPVVIASDQSTIPVAEQNKVASEVALSLLGIPRAEVALGIFADVNTYDVNPSEWTSTPEQFATVSNSGLYSNIGGDMGWGLTHVPAESGALIEAPPDKTGVLTSKRFFRYQPGRVAAATFGVKTSIFDTTVKDATLSKSADQLEFIGASVENPCVRKYGIFDNYDGYYWETRNNGQGDNFSVVRRTQSLIFSPNVAYGGGASEQTEDYGDASPMDPLAKRGSESVGFGTIAVGYPQKKFGDLVVLRDNLLMTHAGVYDPSLLQEEHKAGITSVTASGNVISLVGFAKSVSNAVYNNDTGLMVITTHEPHGFKLGKYLTLSGIGMTCQYSYLANGTLKSGYGGVKYYPETGRNDGYNIVQLNSTTSFTINVGVSTVPTFYYSGGWINPLAANQYVKYDKGTNESVLAGGFTDCKIYKIKTISGVTTTNVDGTDQFPVTVTLKNLDDTDLALSSNHAVGISSHVLITPVPFVQPVSGSLVNSDTKAYSANSTKHSGMFPYKYADPTDSSTTVGYIDTTLTNTATLKSQIDDVNTFYDNWVQQNVSLPFHTVYEYRVPRSRFSGDRLDGATDTLLYSDSVADKRAGSPVLTATGAQTEDTSIWDLAFDKVTMYKIEFSWYGAVGALFLAYVPVSAGEARWVRVHHLRASNQLKVSSLGNATLPITYMVYGGGNGNAYGYSDSNRNQQADYASHSENIIKYGASYYIDGGDRGTVKLFSHGTPTPVDVYGSARTFATGAGTSITVGSASNATDPFLLADQNSIISGLATSYWVGSKVITGESLDQNIEITYVEPSTKQVYLSAPLSAVGAAKGSIKIISNRVTPLIGLECKDFIQSSTGQDVRNRTQVYPTRLSTGSDTLLKVDMIKSPIFQTDVVVSNTGTSPILQTNSATTDGNWNIGKRGKPTKIALNLSTYTGVHTYVEGSTTKTAAIRKNSGGAKLTIADGASAVAYDSATGLLKITTSSAHGLSAGNEINILKEALAFTCTFDRNVAVKKYPRTVDPIFDGVASGGGTNFDGSTTTDAVGVYSRPTKVRTTGLTSTVFYVSITTDIAQGSTATKASDAEFVRKEDTEGVYGYFRGYFETDASQKKISVLGLLENRGMSRTENIEDDGWYFSALESTNDNIILLKDGNFLYENQTTPKEGAITSPLTSKFTLDQLSSVKVNPQIRAPIPKTGTIVASLYAPATGENYDLATYFDYNKEYLSFPLTDKIDSLYLCASTDNDYNVGLSTAKISGSLTWEEQ